MSEELPSIVDDHHGHGLHYSTDFFSHTSSTLSLDPKQPHTGFSYANFYEPEKMEPESVGDQIKGFAKAWGELLLDFSGGCKDIVLQNLMTEDSYIVQRFGGSVSQFSGKLRFLNEYLPEDRDPVLAWPVVFCVFILALAVLNVNTAHHGSMPAVKRIQIHPPSASLILLPDGRNLAYHEQGVPANIARFTLIYPHAFLSSRLAGIPGIKPSLLIEFGIRLITYDLPGFGESDPHPKRDLNSSAHDMFFLAKEVGVIDKFWVFGHSTGVMHVLAALRYDAASSSRIAGAALVSPMVNPYDKSMTKEEMSKIWESWERSRKLMLFLARRFPSFLCYFYRSNFLSGEHGPIEKWLSITLGEKDKVVVESQAFEEHWHRVVEESVRQGSPVPFIEEATLQVSDWGFSLSDLMMRRKCLTKGFLPWLRSMYTQAECELTGFPGPIHIWQGMDDRVVPPTIVDYLIRVLPRVTLHRLPYDGHFSYLYFCDQCHRDILVTLFGDPQGPLEIKNGIGAADTDHYQLPDSPSPKEDIVRFADSGSGSTRA